MAEDPNQTPTQAGDPSQTDDPPVVVAIEKLDAERQYLEGNLSSRSNFYFIFMGAIVAGAFQVDAGPERGVIFLAAGIISFFFWRALFRTHSLVNVILDKICSDHPGHPYSIAREELEGQHWTLPRPGNANHYAAQYIPGAITFALLALGGAYVLQSPAISEALSAISTTGTTGPAPE